MKQKSINSTPPSVIYQAVLIISSKHLHGEHAIHLPWHLIRVQRKSCSLAENDSSGLKEPQTSWTSNRGATMFFMQWDNDSATAT